VHEWPHSRFGPAAIAPPTHRSRVPLARRPRSSASAVPTWPLGMPLVVLGLGLGRGGAGINGEAKGAPVRKPGPRPPDCLFWFAPLPSSLWYKPGPYPDRFLQGGEAWRARPRPRRRRPRRPRHRRQPPLATHLPARRPHRRGGVAAMGCRCRNRPVMAQGCPREVVFNRFGLPLLAPSPRTPTNPGFWNRAQKEQFRVRGAVGRGHRGY